MRVLTTPHSIVPRRRCHRAGSAESSHKKPRSGPVSRVLSLGKRGDGHFSRTPIARRLQQPTRESIASRTGSRPPQRTAPCLALLRVGFTEPAESPRLLVRSYRTFSPLPDPPPGAKHPRAAIGGVFSVALSLASRPVGVTDHPVLRSPDFPPAAGRLAAASAGGRPVHFETKLGTRTSLVVHDRAQWARECWAEEFPVLAFRFPTFRCPLSQSAVIALTRSAPAIRGSGRSDTSRDVLRTVQQVRG